MKNCKTCNNQFTPKDPRKQYCSAKCKWDFDNKKAMRKIAEKRKSVKIESLKDELWSDIEGFEGIYQISNLGRVKGLYLVTNALRGKLSIRFSQPERILSCSISNFGYPRCTLIKDGKCKEFFIHRLIAIAFIPNPNNFPIINHIDGDKKNFSISNLEWCTYAHNSQHAFRTGLNKAYKRINGKGDQSRSKAIKCLKTGKIWKSINKACLELRMSPHSLSRILKNKSKSNNNFIYYNPTPYNQNN